ncbi:MAG: sodium-dependent transporter [Clostridium sp.]|nr:sodium-dependent transporter [Clostridium sp.]
MSKKAKFASKVGVIAATVGSAVGLGNIWRFPAEAQANGGGAFLLVYIACIFLLGIPVMIAEFSLGRAGGSDAVGAFKNLGARRPWWAVGGLSIIASYMILMFYMVVTGWTFEYLWQSVSGALYAPIDSADGTVLTLGQQFSSKMQTYIANPSNSVLNTFVMIAVTFGILVAGVQKGIERMSNILMPALFAILLLLCGLSMTLPKASEGLNYFFKPDFRAITPATLINALGQSFFSLSLGMGILTTYASYFRNNTRLTRTAMTVSLLDLLVAVLMGIIIFPAVMSFNLDGEGLEGATLVFVTLPEFFSQIPATRLWSSLFFLLLLVAALTSTISIAEVTVAFLADRFRLSRIKAVSCVVLPLLFFSTVCALSLGPLSGIHIFNLNIFDFLDAVATNILLPVVSIFLCVYVGWFAPKGLLDQQMSNNGKVHTWLTPIIRFQIRWIAPVLIAIVLIYYFI